MTSSFEECPPAPIWASSTLFTGQASAAVPAAQCRGQCQSRCGMRRAVRSFPAQSSQGSSRFSAHRSGMPPHRARSGCSALYESGASSRPPHAQLQSLPVPGQAIMQKRACWQVLPVGSGNPRNYGGVVSGCRLGKQEFFHPFQPGKFLAGTRSATPPSYRSVQAIQGSAETNVEVTSAIESAPDDHLVAACLDVHDGRGLYLDINNPPVFIASDEVRQFPARCFPAVSRFSCLADSTAPDNPVGRSWRHFLIIPMLWATSSNRTMTLA